jgi:hypothetical protein
VTKQEAADVIDLIIARAPQLREVGVRGVNLGDGVGFTLAAAEPAPDDLDGNQDEESEVPDALHDPWTHGVPRPGTPKVLPKRSRSL